MLWKMPQIKPMVRIFSPAGNHLEILGADCGDGNIPTGKCGVGRLPGW